MKISILLFIVFLFFPMFFYSFGTDASVFAYIGSLFFEGKIPYVDAIDHKGITLYFINGLGYLLGFKNYIGIKVLELFMIIATFLVVYKVLKDSFSNFIAFTSVFFGLATLRYFFDGGNLAEEYGALFTLLALAILIKNEQKNINDIVIGGLFVITLTIRANLISFWIALFFSFMVFYIFQKQTRIIVKRFVMMLIGMLVVILPLVLYFIFTNSFDEFYTAAFKYNLGYSGSTKSTLIQVIIKSIKKHQVSILLFLGWGISMLSIIKRKISISVLLLLFWVPIELCLGNLSHRLYSHYFMMWVPIIVLATSIVLNYFKVDKFDVRRKVFIASIIGTLFFGRTVIYSNINAYKAIINNSKSLNPSKELIEELNKKYSDKNIFVWGNRCILYNETDKRSPIKYFYKTMFNIDSQLSKIYYSDFFKEINENRPDVIIESNISSRIMDLKNDKFIEFKKFVIENYTFKGEINGAGIFEIKKNQ